MTEETKNRNVTLRNGWSLGFTKDGDINGKAVFHLNDSGGSCLLYPAGHSVFRDLEIQIYMSKTIHIIRISQIYIDRRQ